MSALLARPAASAALLGVVSVSGCTAVPALVQCRKAEAGLRGLAGQATRSPEVTYQLTLARAYLDKAREEASEAHYGLSIQLAKSSQQASQRAQAALAGKRGQL